MGRRGRNRKGTLILAAMLAVGLLPVTAEVAAADDFAPEITSFRRTSLDILGSDALVLIEFTASDEGPAGLEYAMFSYRTPLGAIFRVDSPPMMRASSGSYVASKAVGVWAASGQYTLEQVEVYDREGNTTIYERASSSQFDFAAADFRVENPLQDVTTPTVSFVKLFQPVVPQGTPVVVLYGASDDLSGVESVIVSVWSPVLMWGLHIDSLPGLGAAGPAAWVVPLEMATGEYDAFAITVIDRAGNSLRYEAAEPQHVYPPGASIPSHTPPDPDSLDFTVVGTEGDRTPPELLSLSMLTPKTRHLQDQVAIDYQAIDEGTGIRSVHAEWRDDRGHYFTMHKSCLDPSVGPMTAVIEDYRSLDTKWELRNISFSDFRGNGTVYNRNGPAFRNGEEFVHSFDLSVADFTIEAGDPSPHEYPWTATPCTINADVVLDVLDPYIVVGESVTSAGKVSVGNKALPSPIVAIHDYQGDEPRLAALVVGDGDGIFEADWVAGGNAELKATFLGSGVSERSESSTIELTVHPRVNVGFTQYYLRVGERIELRGDVWPARKDMLLSLERKIQGAWKTMQPITMDVDGGFSAAFQAKRAGKFRYRVVVSKTDSLGGGVSSTLVLKIHPR